MKRSNTKRRPTAAERESRAFEQETKRRRRAMIRDLSGRKTYVPASMLRWFPRSSRRILLTKPAARA